MKPTPLRLAFDTGPLYGHRSGVGVAVDEMMRALEKRGDVAVDGYLVSFRSEAHQNHRRLPIPGIVASYAWSSFDRPRADRWLADVDVLHATNYLTPPAKLPTVVSVYDCWFMKNPGDANSAVHRAGQSLRRAAARGAWIHASSEATASSARDLLQTHRVVSVPLGPPAPIPALADIGRPSIADELSGRPLIVAIGTEERRKDLPLLIEAFEHVAKRLRDPLLVVAGATGDDTDHITRTIAATSESTQLRIKRLGIIDAQTKLWLLRSSMVLAYPSLDEGFGFPILEAHSACTPVVARRVGSVEEVAGTAAMLVDNRDPAEFAEALCAALTDTATRLALIESGLRNLGRFSWDTTASGLIDLYLAAIGDST